MSSLLVSICHHPANNERKQYLLSALEDLYVDWIEDFSPRQISDYWKNGNSNIDWWLNSKKRINRFFTFIQIVYKKNSFINKLIFSIKYIIKPDNYLTHTPVGQLSLLLKHDQIIRNFSNSSYDYLLVLEDDAVLHERTFESLNILLKKLNNQEFNSPLYIDVAEGAKISLPWWQFSMSKRKFTKKIKWGFCRTTCGYVIDKPFAHLWVEQNNASKFPSDFVGSDFYMSAFLYLFKINVYFVITPIFFHGSESGKWISNFPENQI